MNILDLVRQANQIANRKVPEFKMLNSPEHEKWLKEYDKAFAQLLLMED